MRASAFAVGTGVRIVNTQKLYTQGSLVNTDNALVDNYYCYPLVNQPEEISVRGYIKTENSNDTRIGVRFYESRCNGIIETQYTSDIDGTTDWSEHYKNIIVPENSRYIDLRMVSFPNDSLESIAYFDNVGVIEWEEWNLDQVLYPNDYYYYQIKSSSNIVNITLNEKSYYFSEQFSIGDNNFDGSIDVIDIILIINISIDIYTPSNEEFVASDANQDGSVNILDIIDMVNLILNEEWNFIADMNYDNAINVLDIIIAVDIILGN